MLVTSGLMILVYAIAEPTRYGWGSPQTLTAGIAAVALLAGFAGFAGRQAIARTPLLPLRVFRSREVSAANGVQMLAVAAAFGFQVLIAQYLQRVLGYSPATADLAILPAAVMIGGLSVGASARLNARFGPRRMLVCGLLPIAVGLALLVRLPVAGAYAEYLLPTMLLTGGFGVAFPAMITLAKSSAAPEDAPEDAGVASGLLNTTQQVGAALGIAVLSTLAASRTATMENGGTAAKVALTEGYRLAFGIGAGLVAGAILVAVVAFGTAGRAPNGTAVGTGRWVKSLQKAESTDRAGEQQRAGDQHAVAHPGHERP